MRPPTPTELLKLTGGFRQDRHGRRMDLPPDGEPRKPDDLDTDAAALWDEVITGAVRRGADAADAPALAAMCRWFALYRRLERQLTGDRPDYNMTVQAGIAFKHFVALASRFGLTLVDRAKLTTVNPTGAPTGIDVRNRNEAPTIAEWPPTCRRKQAAT
jgi:phage terminase small subunit